jgi:hypothetical protein
MNNHRQKKSILRLSFHMSICFLLIVLTSIAGCKKNSSDKKLSALQLMLSQKKMYLGAAVGPEYLDGVIERSHTRCSISIMQFGMIFL